jgi:ATP-dependent RNA helicase DHX36
VLLSPAQIKREKDISDRLKKDLLRKRRAAKEWVESNYSNKNNNSNNSEDSNNITKNVGRQQKQSYDGRGGKRKNQKDNGIFTPQKFHNMMITRQRLPASLMEHEVVQTIDKNQITVIAGATGCGKTTQVPQLVLDDLIVRGLGAATNIIITQPRRISAIGVAGRISEERCEKVGDTCGFSIKLEKKMSNKTRLLLCTTGVLLRRLQCDPDLASVSHIFVDEVHERDLNTDFLIIILKDLLARRKDLKLVLMSATLNSDSFSSYFSGCPVVSIPGRAHPVTENRLEDILQLTGYVVEEDGDYAVKKSAKRQPKISKSTLRRLYHPKYSKETIHSLSIVNECKINYELLSELLEHISFNQGEGAILVFCPGFQEIQKTIEELYKKEYFQSGDVVIYPLHSSLSTEEQIAIFEVPPIGVRKIVVSTNIAETSITIEDVVFVVDTGRVKENRRDEVNETPTLVECWVR